MSVKSDSGEMWRAIDLVCDAYEAARKSGTPSLDEYLSSCLLYTSDAADE